MLVKGWPRVQPLVTFIESKATGHNIVVVGSHATRPISPQHYDSASYWCFTSIFLRPRIRPRQRSEFVRAYTRQTDRDCRMLSSLVLAAVAFAPSAHARWRGPRAFRARGLPPATARQTALNARPTLYEQAMTSRRASMVKFPLLALRPLTAPEAARLPPCLPSEPEWREPSPRHSRRRFHRF